MHFYTLPEWLSWISSIHLSEIELGLERVKEVADRLNLLSPSYPVVIVGGTNGKGSTVAGLESIYRAAGFHVGAFTSPFLYEHNEQVRIDGQFAKDEAFCEAFAKIEKARGDISLTPFEFHTLAALLIFKGTIIDVLLLEVGLGGRLDAVNIIDADVAIVTSIGIDHVEWLGETREKIAREKAGIFRTNKPAICGDPSPPLSLLSYAKENQVDLYCQSRDFFYQENKENWSWVCKKSKQDYVALPSNALALQNMSTVLMAITLLQDQLPVTRKAIDQGLASVTLPGRIQVVEGRVMHIFDVSHNPEAVAHLSKKLKTLPCYGKTYAVFSMLMDKDIKASITAIHTQIDEWYIAPLKTKRAASKDMLLAAFKKANIHCVTLCTSIEEAYQRTISKCLQGDRIIVFGSFHTVSETFPVTELR